MRDRHAMTSLRSILLPCLVLIAALGITWLAWDHERQASRRVLESQFDFALRETASRIEQRMAAYEQILRSVRSLFAATGSMDRGTFRDYVASLQLDASFSGIQVIGIVERGAVVHSPLSDPARQPAMERARDSGKAAISGRIRLAERLADAQTGFAMYLPIYARGQAIGTVAQRRAHFVGWVFATLRMNDLMASLYGEPPPGLALAIHDGAQPSDATLLYRSADAAGRHSPAIAMTRRTLNLAGHDWTLSMSALDDFKALHGRDVSVPIAWAGAGLGLLLALLAWLMATSRDRALRLAAGMTRELRESEQRWAFALEGAGDGVWDWDLKTREVVISRRWREIVGCHDDHRAETIDGWWARIHPDDRPQVAAIMQADMADAPADRNVTCATECRIRCDDGQWKWILSRGMVVDRDAGGRPLRIIGTITDISERKATEERIRHMAQHDALTDLPNRALFSNRLQHELARARRHGERFALIFLDLDKFKPINDNFGHATGDRLLQEVAQRLRDAIRASDTVGRIGGDEFVVLMPELAGSGDALGLAEKIRSILRQPFFIDGRELVISCSLGIAIYPDDGADEIELSRSADEAMYRAKEGGRNGVRIGKAS